MDDMPSYLFQWVLYGSIAITVGTVYLSINQMWPRKHEAVVAESVSTSAQIVSFLTILPFVIQYALKQEYSDAFYQFLWLFYTGFLVLVSVGFWVQDKSNLNFVEKFFKSVRQEKNELGNLVKAVGQSSQNQQLVEILHRLAWLDGELDPRERQYIQAFTDSFDLDSRFLDEKPTEEYVEKFIDIRQTVEAYLKVKPPHDQVQLLDDLVQALIDIDNNITQEEKVIAAEIKFLLNCYRTGESDTDFGVIIHPRNSDQEAKILSLVPDAQQCEVLGDKALIACTFHTRDFAEIRSQSYRQQGWFTVVYQLISSKTPQYVLS